ncbi:MAG: hypothetical protein AAGB10_08340 [Pseudomonadota bacterium]
MNTPHSVRLHLYFARSASLAVILRQGPSRAYRMILWNHADDSFIDGQWLKSNIYIERCDISPDGRWFLYFALDGRQRSSALWSFTAISRPPWFTALALYPQGDTWGGGGRFVDAKRYTVDTAVDPGDTLGRAAGTERVFRGTPDTHNTLGFHHRDGRRVNLRPRDRAFWEGAEEPERPFETDGGRLYRTAGASRVLVRDFTDMQFEPIRAPYDWREEPEDPPTAWHPLDAEEGQ